MSSPILLGALIGGAVGAALGYVKFRSALPGAMFGAACGTLLVFLFGNSPATVIAVQSPGDFQRDVLSADRPVLVDFYADWCPPCKRLAPTIEGLASEYKERARVVKVDVDKARQLAQTYGVRGIPTVILFVDGNPAQRWVGARPAEVYQRALDAVIAAQGR